MSNDKAGPREDQQRKHEEESLLRGAPVESRTERRLAQDTEDLSPGSRPLTARSVGGSPPIDETNRKSDFARWFRPSEFPADRRRLARTAADEGAPDWVLETIGRLDADRSFSTVTEAWEAACAAGARR